MYQDYNNLKNDLETQLKSLQYTGELFDMKKLNEGDEAENILILRNTVFIGNNRMQIKKLDGTIEKYNIEKYYPVDEKDEMIKKLNEKVEELERRLNNEPTKYIESNTRVNEPDGDDDEPVEPESKTNCESVSNEE